jgi:8-oxo-dGTP pyrophosphatase MutT (NUDIX family)
MNHQPVLFSTPWITVKETPDGFQFLERKGKDSVAIFLFRRNNVVINKYEVLIRQQRLCIDNPGVGQEPNLYPCPITGGIDANENPEEAAVREVLEESGFSAKVLPLGRYIVGTQTNEICYLFYADVTGQTPGRCPTKWYLLWLNQQK